MALQAATTLTPACANAAAAAASAIESSNDRARVLVDFAGHGFLTEATRIEFFRAARGTDSSYDLRRILTEGRGTSVVGVRAKAGAHGHRRPMTG